MVLTIDNINSASALYATAFQQLVIEREEATKVESQVGYSLTKRQ